MALTRLSFPGARRLPLAGALWLLLLGLTARSSVAAVAAGPVLRADAYRHYVEDFNAHDEERYPQHIPNAAAWAFLSENVPLFECPDKELELTYYFRWWTFRKHIKQTPDGFIITEFLPPVPWAGKHNSINCPAGHHFYEGRWLRDARYLDDYSVFWFRKGGDPHRYSFWAADALWARYLVNTNRALLTNLLPDLVANFEAWEKKRRDPNGLFWQEDGQDGMEVSIGGSGYRATINSYMFGDAAALAHIADLAGQPEVASHFRSEAARTRQLVETRLWDAQAQFFKVAPRTDSPSAKSAGILEWKVNNDPALTRAAKPSASHCWERDTLAALNDGREPKSSGDPTLPRMTFWDHQGTTEWVQYDFPARIEARSVQVYWFQDTAGCRVPKEWRLLYREDSAWRPVKSQEPATVAPDRYNSLSFEPVNTAGLRIELVCQGVTAPVAPPPLRLAGVRELHGYTPWYFHLPEARFAVAWKQLVDPLGFRAPFGPTTAEQRHPKFAVVYSGHECQWNGPSWPYSTAITLTALANVLNDLADPPLTRRDYFDTLRTYALSHRLKRADGHVVPWIDENLNPHTGDWIARTLLLQRKQKPVERGKDYNHSSFCDLVISGLVGLRPRADNVIEVNPLVPDDAWDWFCLDRVLYHGRVVTIVWDRSGARYGKGPGLRVFADGKEVASSSKLTRVTGDLP
jgi:hypothetical protein